MRGIKNEIVVVELIEPESQGYRHWTSSDMAAVAIRPSNAATVAKVNI